MDCRCRCGCHLGRIDKYGRYTFRERVLYFAKGDSLRVVCTNCGEGLDYRFYFFDCLSHIASTCVSENTRRVCNSVYNFMFYTKFINRNDSHYNFMMDNWGFDDMYLAKKLGVSVTYIMDKRRLYSNDLFNLLGTDFFEVLYKDYREANFRLIQAEDVCKKRDISHGLFIDTIVNFKNSEGLCNEAKYYVNCLYEFALRGRYTNYKKREIFLDNYFEDNTTIAKLLDVGDGYTKSLRTKYSKKLYHIFGEDIFRYLILGDRNSLNTVRDRIDKAFKEYNFEIKDEMVS